MQRFLWKLDFESIKNIPMTDFRTIIKKDSAKID